MFAPATSTQCTCPAPSPTNATSASGATHSEYAKSPSACDEREATVETVSEETLTVSARSARRSSTAAYPSAPAVTTRRLPTHCAISLTAPRARARARARALAPGAAALAVVPEARRAVLAARREQRRRVRVRAFDPAQGRAMALVRVARRYQRARRRVPAEHRAAAVAARQRREIQPERVRAERVVANVGDVGVRAALETSGEAERRRSVPAKRRDCCGRRPNALNNALFLGFLQTPKAHRLVVRRARDAPVVGEHVRHGPAVSLQLRRNRLVRRSAV